MSVVRRSESHQFVCTSTEEYFFPSTRVSFCDRFGCIVNVVSVEGVRGRMVVYKRSISPTETSSQEISARTISRVLVSSSSNSWEGCVNYDSDVHSVSVRLEVPRSASLRLYGDGLATFFSVRGPFREYTQKHGNLTSTSLAGSVKIQTAGTVNIRNSVRLRVHVISLGDIRLCGGSVSDAYLVSDGGIHVSDVNVEKRLHAVAVCDVYIRVSSFCGEDAVSYESRSGSTSVRVSSHK